MARSQFWANQFANALQSPVDTGLMTYPGGGAAPYEWSQTGNVPNPRSITWTAPVLNSYMDNTPFFPMIEVYFDMFTASGGGIAQADLYCPLWGVANGSQLITTTAVVGAPMPMRMYLSPPTGKWWGFRKDHAKMLEVILGLSNQTAGITAYCRNFTARLFWVPAATRPLGWNGSPVSV